MYNNIVKDYICKADLDNLCFEKNKGDFSPRSDEAFEKHLKKLSKYVEFAKQQFPCTNTMEFVSYVLTCKPYWYSGGIKVADLK